MGSAQCPPPCIASVQLRLQARLRLRAADATVRAVHAAFPARGLQNGVTFGAGIAQLNSVFRDGLELAAPALRTRENRP